MLDCFDRDINYMRISITDRCNNRCMYCMPDEISFLSHEEILRYEEILRICKIAVSLGITRFKVTGGEPLLRKDFMSFIRALKQMDQVEEVTLTTNGLLLNQYIDDLSNLKIDGITVSIPSLKKETYQCITGNFIDVNETLLKPIEKCIAHSLKTKVNTVLLKENMDELTEIASLSEKYPIDVRFIEEMPIGKVNKNFVSSIEAIKLLKEKYPDLREVEKNIRRGNGPARYYESEKLMGKIGFIDAMSHKFCDSCNRIRLTSTGLLKPCLSFDTGISLRESLRSGKTDEEIYEVMKNQIFHKPKGHIFLEEENKKNSKMSQIGG